jgi:DNA transformation protein
LDNPDELRELFAAFGPVRVRRMFGGAGIFADRLMIALVSGGEIFLKADDATIPTLKAEGSQPFVYGARGRRVVMSYWRLPDRLLDDPEALAEFARAALGAAHRAAPGGSSKRVRRPKQAKRPAARPHRRAQSRR